MPKGKKALLKKNPSTSPIESSSNGGACDLDEEEEEDEQNDDFSSSNNHNRLLSMNSKSGKDDTPVLSRGSKRRDHGDDGKEEEFSCEMKKLLESFEADITKSLASKRKRLESFTQNKMKSSNKKVEDIWKVQQAERQKLYDEYCNQVNNILQQWDNDLGKNKEQEEKMMILFRQQQKLFQQNLVIQQQRLQTLRDLQEHFNKGLKDLERCHQEQQTTVQSELRKEMALLQKKILMDTQQQEMANVRKSLQSMLY